jgi:excisionase family DNA binding protein
MPRTATTSEVAVALGLAPATVQKYARDRRIPFDLTPGGHRRFDVEEVRAVLSMSADAKVASEERTDTNEHTRSRATAVILTALGLEYDAVRARLESWKPVRSSGGTRF